MKIIFKTIFENNPITGRNKYTPATASTALIGFRFIKANDTPLIMKNATAIRAKDLGKNQPLK